jgi:hypothetical protein
LYHQPLLLLPEQLLLSVVFLFKNADPLMIRKAIINCKNQNSNNNCGEN